MVEAERVVDYLGKLMVEDYKFLWPFENKMTELRRELVWMQSFLRDADSLPQDEIVAQWVMEIKGYVYEAEDIVDKFIIKIAERRRSSDWKKVVRSCFGSEIVAMHLITSKIDSLVQKVSMLTQSLEKYGLMTSYGMKTNQTIEVVSGHAYERMSYAHLDLNSNKAVGLDEDSETIVNALLDSDRRVVGIYGMGGLGKTTLATKVFNDEKIKRHFVDGCSWAYISKQFRLESVLRVIITGLVPQSSTHIMSNETKDLMCDLRALLQSKKCLVVLDDVWEMETWDFLKDAFPQRSDSGSKVLLISRKQEVAKAADHSALPKPDPLDDAASWELFVQSLGWDASGHGETAKELFGIDGMEVIDLGKTMLRHCNGIPLAIVVLGGILRKKESVEEWRIVRDNIYSYLRRGNDRGKSYMEVLALSYNDLPYSLKPCFLHLGNFPEGYEIDTETLCRMWVAEGLVSWPRDRVLSRGSLEDIARDYVAELTQCGMVQIVSKGSKGRIQTIRLHDLMRDVCLEKGIIKNVLSIIDHRGCSDEPEYISSSVEHEKLLRMAIYLAPEVKNYFPDFLYCKANECIRSLLLFAAREVSEEGLEKWVKSIFNHFSGLRVLDIEGLRVKGKLTQDVKKLIHLRFLSLKGTGLSEFPSSIGNLVFLESLDLRVSSPISVKIPNTLCNLEHLRHLFLPETRYEVKKSKLLRLDTLGHLETLEHLEAGTSNILDVQKLRN